MTEINMDTEDNTDGKPTLPTSVPAGGTVRPAWPDSLRAILTGRVARSEVSARRYWLRFLDAPFAKEFRTAGALDVSELLDAVSRILRCEAGRISIATIEEWWEFATRRRWLEKVGSRWGLTERADNDLRIEWERVNSPDPRRLVRGIARSMLPTSLVGAVGLVSGKYLVLEAAIFVVAGTAIFGLLLAAGLWGVLEPRMDRWAARRACDWLEGRRVWPARGANRGQTDFTRLYDSGIKEKLI